MQTGLLAPTKMALEVNSCQPPGLWIREGEQTSAIAALTATALPSRTLLGLQHLFQKNTPPWWKSWKRTTLPCSVQAVSKASCPPTTAMPSANLLPIILVSPSSCGWIPRGDTPTWHLGRHLGRSAPHLTDVCKRCYGLICRKKGNLV